MDMIPVSKMLDRMSNEMLMINEQVELVKNIGPNACIFRARICSNDEKLSTAKDFGTVPLDKANYSNRMSPAVYLCFTGHLTLKQLHTK